MKGKSIDQQKLIVQGRLKQAQTYVEYLIQSKFEEMTELMLERVETLGKDEYDDTSFRLSSVDLEVEVAQEIADAIFYAAVMVWRSEQELDKRPRK